jgi:hypothetical protein
MSAIQSIESAVCALLLTRAVLVELINEKCYPVAIPQGVEPPFVVVQTITGSEVQTDMGASEMKSPMVGVTIFAKTADEYTAIRRQVMAELNRFFGKQQILGLQLIDGIYDQESDIFNDALDLKGKRLEFEIWHNEPFVN